MAEVMKTMATSFKRSDTWTADLSALNPAAGHCQPTPLLETPRHSWAFLGQFLVGSLLLSPGSWCSQGTKGTFYPKMSTIKDKNDMDLTEAEDIKKRWQESTEKLTKKIFMTKITTMV